MPFLAQEHRSISNQDILSWACDGHAYDQDKPIYIDASDHLHSLSATQIKGLICQLIAGFRAAGVRQGDTVLVHSFNHIYYPAIVLGIIGAGAVFAGTNPSYTRHELRHALHASKATLILSEPEIVEHVLPAAKEENIPADSVFVLDTTESQSIPEGFKSWKSLLGHGSQDGIRFDDEKFAKATVAMLLFSSGTTGLPKPAMLSHHNLVAQHTLVFEHRPRPYHLSRLVALPMFHAATAPSTHTSPLRSGHTQIIMRRFEVNTFMENCEKYQISDLTLVPPQITAFVSSPIELRRKKEMLRFTKAALAGAAPLDKDMQARFQALLPEDCPFTQIWAMTETSCFASLFYYPENDDTGSVGRFIPNIDVKLVDDEGNDTTSHGVRGELWIRGPTVVQGYVGVPREKDFDREGYFKTGDILYCEENTGLWYIVDRRKELIKVRGFQVAPAELEGALLAHPGILDAAVIGIPSKSGDSELPKAFVVKKTRTDSLSELDVKAFLEGRLARYKWLEGGVTFVDTIPKTPSGKILKRMLRDQSMRERGAKL